MTRMMIPHLKEVYLHELYQEKYYACEAKRALIKESRKAGWKVINKFFTQTNKRRSSGSVREDKLQRLRGMEGTGRI